MNKLDYRETRKAFRMAGGWLVIRGNYIRLYHGREKYNKKAESLTRFDFLKTTAGDRT